MSAITLTHNLARKARRLRLFLFVTNTKCFNNILPLLLFLEIASIIKVYRSVFNKKTGGVLWGCCRVVGPHWLPKGSPSDWRPSCWPGRSLVGWLVFWPATSRPARQTKESLHTDRGHSPVKGCSSIYATKILFFLNNTTKKQHGNGTIFINI